MKHKIFIMNDRQIPMSIRIVDTTDVAWEGRYFILEVNRGEVFELDLLEDQIPYLKIWEDNSAFLSHYQSP